MDSFKATDRYYFVPGTLTATLQAYIAGTKYYICMKFGQFTTSSMKKLINSTNLQIVNKDLNLILYDGIQPNTKILSYLNSELWLGMEVNTYNSSQNL